MMTKRRSANAGRGELRRKRCYIQRAYRGRSETATPSGGEGKSHCSPAKPGGGAGEGGSAEPAPERLRPRDARPRDAQGAGRDRAPSALPTGLPGDERFSLTSRSPDAAQAYSRVYWEAGSARAPWRTPAPTLSWAEGD